MADIIQFRRDTLERWSEFNPTLAEGEIGFVLGSYQYKVGDGVHAWNDLPLSFNGNIVDLFTNNEDEGYDSVISQGGLSTIFKYIVSNGSHIDISSSWTSLDEFNTIDKCGFYVLMRGKTPCYHMMITADSMAHGVCQWIFGNLSIDDDGQIRGGHWDGRAHILFRYIGRGQSTWSNWKYLQNDFISNDGETNQQIPDTAYAPSLNYFKKVVDEIQTAITANTENIAEVREAMITDISVNGDAEGVNITQENTLTHAGIAMKIPNADVRSNKAGVVTGTEIRALYEIDLAAADVTNIGFEKDAEKNKITLTGIGQLGDNQSSEIELTPATSEFAGLMSADDKTKVGNYPEQFVLDLGILNSQSEGENIAAKSEVAGNRNISFIRFKVQGVSELKTTLIMQWPNGINETAQIMCVDKQQWRRNVTGATGVVGAPTNAYNWSRTAPHSIVYDEQRRMIQLKDYETQPVSRGVELPLATSSKPGLMSSADKTKLDNVDIAAIQAKNLEQDSRLANAEGLNTKQNERLLNYVYPKLYQLNEGVGALPFDGMYSGSASVLDGRKTVAVDGCTYKVVFSSGKFLLLEINQDGEDAGLYEAWDNIISGRGSSEDYKRKDCLYYVYTEGEGSYYYYVDADGNISEQAGTYLLRKLIDDTNAKITGVESTANDAKSAAETARTAAQEAKRAAENEATARIVADTELQSQINGKQDNIGSLSKDEKAAFLVSLGLGKIGIISQKQTWNNVGVEPAYVMSEKVEGFISKDNIDSLISYGFAFNEGTGYFELNGLTDISLQEALNIVAAGKPNFSLCDLHYAYKNIRTNLPILDNVNYNVYFGNGVSNPIRITYMAGYSNIEVFAYYPYKINNNYNNTGLKNSSISKGSLAFFSCQKLEKIDVIPGTAADLFQSFLGCVRLKELELVYLRCDVDLSSSAYLSAKSTHIMIANADNKKTITITLHPDAKARWEASEYYAEDSQTIITKNITIA